MHFPLKQNIFGKSRGSVKAVDGVSIQLYKGETLALVSGRTLGTIWLQRFILGAAQVQARRPEVQDRSARSQCFQAKQAWEI